MAADRAGKVNFYGQHARMVNVEALGAVGHIHVVLAVFLLYGTHDIALERESVEHAAHLYERTFASVEVKAA